MTINEALKAGNNHIICMDGTEFDVKPSRDGGYIFHHIEKRGKPVARNRVKMTPRDADTWIKRKHQNIKSAVPGKYEKFIPEPDDDFGNDYGTNISRSDIGRDNTPVEKASEDASGYVFDEVSSEAEPEKEESSYEFEEVTSQFEEVVEAEEEPGTPMADPVIEAEEEPEAELETEEEQEQQEEMSEDQYIQEHSDYSVSEEEPQEQDYNDGYDNGGYDNGGYDNNSYGNSYNEPDPYYQQPAQKDIQPQYPPYQQDNRYNQHGYGRPDPREPRHIVQNYMDEQPSQPATKSSIIFEDMVMNGDIETQGSVEVYGSIKGNISAAGSVKVTGCVDGDITAGDIFVNGSNGEVVGNMSGNQMQIDNGCVVIGDVKAGELVVEGAVMGDIDVGGQVYIRSTAIVKGNIVSKSIVIEDGATIDGRCAQAYADVQPDDFFNNYIGKLTGKPINKEYVNNQSYDEPLPAKQKEPKEYGNMSLQRMLNG